MKLVNLKIVLGSIQKFFDANPKDKLPVVITSKIDDNHYKIVTGKPLITRAYVYTSEIEGNSVSTLFNEEDLSKIPSLKTSTTEVTLIEIP